MTTTTVPIQITCPDWCSISPEEHAAELWNCGGVCDHRSTPRVTDDTAGSLSEPCAERRFNSALEVLMIASTAPDGRPQSTPTLEIDGGDATFQQGVEFAVSIWQQVLAYYADADMPAIPRSDMLKQVDRELLTKMVELADGLRSATLDALAKQADPVTAAEEGGQ